MIKEHAIIESTRLNFLATSYVVAFLHGSDFLSADLGDFSLLESAAGLAWVKAGARMALAGELLVCIAGELVFTVKVAGGGSLIMTAPGTAFPLFSLSTMGFTLASPPRKENFTTELF